MSKGRFPARTAYQHKHAAEVYDEERLSTLRERILHKLELRAITRGVHELPKDSRVLDLPCGTGRVWAPLIKHCAFVQGVDISKEMIDVARKRYQDAKNVSFVQADGTNLPFNDNEFDCVFSLRFFGHAPPEVRQVVLKEMARVTKNRVAVVMYVRDSLITLRKHLQWIVKPRKNPWYPIYSRKELNQLFKGVGLTIREVWSLMPGVMESRMVIATKD